MTRNFPIAAQGFPFIFGSAGLAALALGFGLRSVGLVLALLSGFCTFFFRNPLREIPEGEGLIVSPADGKVTDVSPVERGRYLDGPAVKVSIFLSIFDVHVNRIPYTGRIAAIFYNRGRFFPAQQEKASMQNEQNALLLEAGSGRRLVCVQIAGWIARRIVCWVKEGDILRRGERFGLIRFGSRVDLYLPPNTQIRVRPGDRVKGGESVIGVIG